MSDQAAAPAPQGTGTPATPAQPAAGVNPPAQTPAQTQTNQPAIKYAGKYESVEALHKGIVNADPSYTMEQLAKIPVDVAESLYKTAQRALTRQRQDIAGNATGGGDNPMVIPVAPNVEIDESASPRAMFEKAGVNFDAAMQEVATKGSLSEANRKALAEAYKMDNSAVKLAVFAAQAAYKTEQAERQVAVQARNAQLETAVYPLFGGREKMEQTLADARTKMDAGEIAFFNEAFASPDVSKVAAAAKAFQLLLAQKTGHATGSTVTATGHAATASKPATTAEMRSVLLDMSRGRANIGQLDAALKGVPVRKGN